MTFLQQYDILYMTDKYICKLLSDRKEDNHEKVYFIDCCAVALEYCLIRFCRPCSSGYCSSQRRSVLSLLR